MSIIPATEEAIATAAKLLLEGKLIGMPTETVYGIAADALNPVAVEQTFVLKGRPAENPLIVHVSSVDQARGIVRELPPEASMLAEKFWPGPLTLVLPKAPEVPSQVTAGLDTVAVRMPSHPVALRLIELTGVPLSAPSANRFTEISPTTAQMIDPAIANGLAMILDGGPCRVGIESTVLDLTGPEPAILRPGHIMREQIESVLGRPIRVRGTEAGRKGPGMYAKHYAPRNEVRLVDRLQPGEGGLILSTEPGKAQIKMPSDPSDYARELYARLHELDSTSDGPIYIERPPQTPEWAAVWDRLRKASGGL